MAAIVVQAGNDQEQLVPVLLRVKQNLGQLTASVSADAGYFSSAAVTAEEIKTVAVHVPPNAREPQAGECAALLPEKATVQQRMWHKLKSKEESSGLQPTQGDRRTGLCLPQTCARLSSISVAGPGPSRSGMVVDVSDS